MFSGALEIKTGRSVKKKALGCRPSARSLEKIPGRGAGFFLVVGVWGTRQPVERGVGGLEAGGYGYGGVGGDIWVFF